MNYWVYYWNHGHDVHNFIRFDSRQDAEDYLTRQIATCEDQQPTQFGYQVVCGTECHVTPVEIIKKIKISNS